MRLPTGEWFTLPLSSHFASEAFITDGNVDWGSEALLYQTISGVGAFLDVGANIGYYSLYMLPKAAAVYSFEPDPTARMLLEQNISGRSTIEVVPHAVGAVQGEATFVLECSSELSHLSMHGEGGKNTVGIKVTTIDAFVSTRKIKVESIKIDAEGHDIQVLEGALNVLRDQRPLVLTEAKPEPQLFSLMEKTGYRVFAFVRDHRSRKRTFEELLPNVPPRGATKMMFLVPPQLASSVVKNASMC
jgi:FkbM family methyltransferase